MDLEATVGAEALEGPGEAGLHRHTDRAASGDDGRGREAKSVSTAS